MKYYIFAYVGVAVGQRIESLSVLQYVTREVADTVETWLQWASPKRQTIMETAVEISREWRDALKEIGFDPDSEGAELLLSACEDEGIQPDQLCDALQGITTGWTEDCAGRNYAMELADECGSVPDNLAWPLTCIDWDQAWRELWHDGFRLYSGPSDTWFVMRAV